MASLRQIRSRIRSIQSSKQIMRAMQLVSASKLKRAQTRLMQARNTMAFLDSILQRVLASSSAVDHPLVQKRDGPSALVVLTSDAGLCGSYNTNLIQMAEAHLRRDAARTTRLIFIGKKGYRHFTKRGYPALQSYLDLAGRPNLARAAEIARALTQAFLSGSVASISVLHSRFASSSVYKPTINTWLPLTLSLAETGAKVLKGGVDYLLEPSPERVLGDLLPRWAVAKFQLAMLESFTSEHSARMIAMKNATDNAQTLLNELTTQRNKVRQAAITKELSEIVGTAEALK